MYCGEMDYTKEYIREKTTVDPESGCWLWNKSLDPYGYGRIYQAVSNTSRKCLFAHRITYKVFFGEFDESLYVLHRCDTRACNNPEHLFLGTNKDNTDDRTKKGRSAKGEGHGMVKLTENDVRAIRKSSKTQKQLADQYGVTEGTIAHIIHRRSWKHVE